MDALILKCNFPPPPPFCSFPQKLREKLAFEYCSRESERKELGRRRGQFMRKGRRGNGKEHEEEEL